MSDNETEVSPDGLGSEQGLTGSFSANGNDPGAVAVATDGSADAWVDDGAAFLQDLARAMQTTATAEHARDAEATGHRLQAHLDAIRAREALEAEELREYAKEDVKGIDAWSDGEIKRVKLERERRIASRREQLQIRLEEHRAVVAREVEAVEAAIATYRVETEQFFGRLETETDPVEIARQAGSRPVFPMLELIGPNDVPIVPAEPTPPAVVTYYSAPAAAPVEAPAAAPVEAQVPPAQPDPAAVDDEHGTDDGPGAASPLIGVMDPVASDAPAETPWDTGTEVTPEPVEPALPVSEGVEAPVSEELVAIAAEARVVMPKSSGAGSWLRWPNSSVDRPDSSR